MRSLVVLAHHDDEAISCPQYLLDNPGTFVFIVCGDDDRKKAFNKVSEVTASFSYRANFKPLALSEANIPSIAKAIEALVSTSNIKRVITHHPSDAHQDHNIVTKAVTVALRRSKTELLYVKNPEGFPFETVHWDTMVKRSTKANKLVYYYKNINYPEPQEYECYQTIRRFSI